MLREILLNISSGTLLMPKSSDCKKSVDAYSYDVAMKDFETKLCEIATSPDKTQFLVSSEAIFNYTDKISIIINI